jgi:dTDP-4-dehydrorhamnose 3,5-epimerase
MELTPLSIEGVWLAESPVWTDERGFFIEWFKSDDINKATGFQFVLEQANVSLSSRGTLRGIHYSTAPRGQAKWITCVSGSIWDVVVDIRPNSPTFNQWISIELTSGSGKAVFISEGLGHGFLALEDKTVVAYLVTTSYSPSDEHEINPLDKEIAIEWPIPISQIKISKKDSEAPTLAQVIESGELTRKPH